jgi:hypothetical protein
MLWRLRTWNFIVKNFYVNSWKPRSSMRDKKSKKGWKRPCARKKLHIKWTCKTFRSRLGMKLDRWWAISSMDTLHRLRNLSRNLKNRNLTRSFTVKGERRKNDAKGTLERLKMCCPSCQ